MRLFSFFTPRCRTSVALIVLVIFASAAHAQKITTIDVPNSIGTIPRGINNSGEIVGDYLDLNGRFGGFLRQHNGGFITLKLFRGPFPSRWQTRGTGINVSGNMIGYIAIAGGGETAYFRQTNGKIVFFNNGGDVTSSAALAEPSPLPDCVDGTEPVAINAVGEITGSTHCVEGLLRQKDGTITAFRVALDTGEAYTVPQAINVKAQITGYYRQQSYGSSGGFLRQPDGSIITFDVLTSAVTRPKAINDSGRIAGYYVDADSVSHGFLRQPDGDVSTFDPTGSMDTQVTAMNKKGEIIGFYSTADGMSHGFVRNQDGFIESFDAPGADAGTFPQGINDLGEIVGYYEDATSALHGFVRAR